MYSNQEWLRAELDAIEAQGLTKSERLITGPQGPEINTDTGRALNFCANNYLGLADNSNVISAAKEGLNRYGFGLSSVRFICGTQTIHTELESRIAEFLGVDAAILYTSCFDANAGLFETVLSKEDTVISDELNHASIIDGIRLSKANRLRYQHANMESLEKCLKEAKEARFRLIATDGVFSMHGDLAPLLDICDLAEKYQALVMVDDSHATGVVGETGRGTAEHFGVVDRIDIVTSTLGKALGGASGGFTAGRQEIIDLLRQRNPHAMMRDPMTIEDHQHSRMISEPLRKFDCCLETDGALAVVVTTPERARDLKQRPVAILGAAQGMGPDHVVMANYHKERFLETPSLFAAREVYAQAGVEPRDIDCAQWYDAFTPLVILSLEEYGFCKPGEGGPFSENGRLEWPDGALPSNTSGGGLSEAYVHGFNLILEGVRQMRGTSTCQVEDAELCLVTSGGGVPTSAAILART